MEPQRYEGLLAPALSRRKREGVPQPVFERRFVEVPFWPLRMHRDHGPDLHSWRNFADCLPTILPLLPGEGRGEGVFFWRFMQGISCTELACYGIGQRTRPPRRFMGGSAVLNRFRPLLISCLFRRRSVRPAPPRRQR